jgi:hypothetical protein
MEGFPRLHLPPSDERDWIERIRDFKWKPSVYVPEPDDWFLQESHWNADYTLFYGSTWKTYDGSQTVCLVNLADRVKTVDK